MQKARIPEEGGAIPAVQMGLVRCLGAMTGGYLPGRTFSWGGSLMAPLVSKGLMPMGHKVIQIPS